jgi:acyl-CoA synthetase (AMP-forming)/AMP-acid ligase II
VEDVLYKHPDVLLPPSWRKPDPKWGEVPCAFIELKDGRADHEPEDIVAHCKQHLAGFKVPRACGVQRTAQDQHRENPEVRAAQAFCQRWVDGGH